MNFIYFEEDFHCKYPVGEFYDHSFDFIKEAAKAINNNIEKNAIIALVCRGTSGCIIAGSIAYYLKKRSRDVTIVVSRKPEENSHGLNMEGVNLIRDHKAIPVIIDDFISSGHTIWEILNDLDEYIGKKDIKYPFLCIGNSLNEGKFKSSDSIKFKTIANRFNTIICNRVG